MPLVAEFAERTIVMSRKKVLLDGLAHDVFSQPELLETTNIKPPQIAQFGRMLEQFIPLPDTMLCVSELGDELIRLQTAAQ